MEKDYYKEKHGYPPVYTTNVRHGHRPASKLDVCRRWLTLACKYAFGAAVIALLWLVSMSFVFDSTPHETRDGRFKLVPLEAHIMSKCPDALACLEKLIVPTMSLTSSKVNFTLSYIGTAHPNSDEVTCKHGPSECLGNILELCAAHTYPDPKIYLGFTLCISKKYELIPDKELIEDCAAEHGIDFDKLNDCASKEDGAFGMDLLRESVERSQNVSASISCTVRLAGKVRCVRDAGVWKDCKDGSSVESLVGDIEALYEDGREARSASACLLPWK